LWEKHLLGSGNAESTKQLMLDIECRPGSPGAIMFKRRAIGQRIFPSDPAAPSVAPAPAAMTTSDSISADLDYLHQGEEEREG
jgi:hypothetical protein